MFNTTFNNNSATSSQSVLLVEDDGVPEDELYYMMLYQVHPIWVEFELILNAAIKLEILQQFFKEGKQILKINSNIKLNIIYYELQQFFFDMQWDTCLS